MAMHVYLDHAATTPAAPEVVRAMAPFWRETFGNPSSAHWFGQEAVKAVDGARETLARFLGCSPLEVYFTGSATEADNLAVAGVIAALAKIVRFPKSNSLVSHIVTSAVEHEAVLEPCKQLEKMGLVEVTYVPVNREGVVAAADVARAIKPTTALVSIMYANSEIGTIQPVAEVGRVIRKENERRAAEYLQIKSNAKRRPERRYNKNECFSWRRRSEATEGEGSRSITGSDALRDSSATPQNDGRTKLFPIRFHTDAAQAAQFLDCNVERLNVDLLTLSAHKIYGPKGIGALYVRRGTPLEPIIRGGGQERGLRSGTENVPYIAGFGEAVKLIAEQPKNSREKIARLRDYFIEQLLRRIPGAALNGSRDERLPNNVNVRIPGVSSETLVIALDQAGVAVSTGSACASRGLKSSHVLEAIGVDTVKSGSVRLTLGRSTTKAEVDYAVKALKEAVEKLRGRKSEIG